jgi:cytochrome o ubiquinol oxidase operon protein cyoD
MHRELSLKPYLIASLLSAIALAAATAIARMPSVPFLPKASAIAILGLFQVAIQFLYFYGLAVEERPRWNLLLFSFMFTVAIIIVVGSLWIMYNLDYRMMGPMMPSSMGM